MLRRTKIVATLGPATDRDDVLRRIIKAGVDVVRLNFSHGHARDQVKRANQVRIIAAECGRTVAILGDLQGPKIRVAKFSESKITLAAGDNFTLDAQWDKDAGDQLQVGIDYPELPQDCQPGDILLLDDGRVVLKVERIEASRIGCKVEVGGVLSNNKGINRKGGGLSAPALTVKDQADILTAAEIAVDYLAVSFPRSAKDIDQARQLIRQAGSDAGIVAKIERAEAVAGDEQLDDIIHASDAVMVARGDLGVEIGDAELIGVQKRIISRTRKLNKVVITATQMMESMINSPLPTRAEVFDVANAVLDGTDAVMLSAETAAGDYPLQTVEAMERVILGAERQRSTQRSSHRLNQSFDRIDESIAMAAMYSANHLEGVRAIICMTETGYTPLMMSRIRSGLPIFCLSPHPRTQNRVALYRGVNVIALDQGQMGNDERVKHAISMLKQQDVVAAGDLVIVSRGESVDVQGGTNTLIIVRVG